MNVLFLIGGVSMGVALGVFICTQIAHAEDFIFNQTKRMQDEEKLLAFCISNTTIKIPDVDKFCAMSYGGLNTSYGESVDKK